MPWDETSIRMADLKGGESSNEVTLKDGTGKQINYSEPTWDGDELLTVNDSTNWWNVYKSAAEPNSVEKNLNPIQREISYPLWQLGFRNYVLNKKYLVRILDWKFKTFFKYFKPKFTIFNIIS